MYRKQATGMFSCGWKASTEIPEHFTHPQFRQCLFFVKKKKVSTGHLMVTHQISRSCSIFGKII